MRITTALLTATLVLPGALPTRAQDAKAPALTVAEVMQAGASLRQLGKFRFPPEALMDMAINIRQADIVQKAGQDAIQALIRQTYGSAEAYQDLQGRIAADRTVVDRKAAAFNEAAERIYNSPSKAIMVPIKRSDLCLAEAPPACPQANVIPVDVLRGLLPLLGDR